MIQKTTAIVANNAPAGSNEKAYYCNKEKFDKVFLSAFPFCLVYVIAFLLCIDFGGNNFNRCLNFYATGGKTIPI